VWITRDELFDARRGIERRADFASSLFDPVFPPTGTPALAQSIADCLVNFTNLEADANGKKRLPWAAPLALATAVPDRFKNDEFADQRILQAGRVPFTIKNTQDDISAQGPPGTQFVLGSWLNTPCSGTGCRLLTNEHCPASWKKVSGGDTPIDNNKASQHGWWDKWKDHFFYAVSSPFKAKAPSTGSECAPSGADCISVDGAGPFAAVVIFAGAPLSGQSRATLDDKNNLSNYLEGVNVTALQADPVDASTFGKFSSLVGNDKFVCITQNMTLDLTCSPP
ncbi:MAG: hypothetical protein V4623_09010, partial [Pseudomonadota bacterium]